MAGAAVTDMPPPRWKVIERGRRLEVIDTQASGSRRLSPVDPTRPARLSLPRRVRFDGGAELTTHPLYDDHAPRTILLDPGSAATLKRVQAAAVIAGVLLVVALVFWPWLLIGAVPLFQRDIRRPLRAAATRWLDRVEREGR